MEKIKLFGRVILVLLALGNVFCLSVVSAGAGPPIITSQPAGQTVVQGSPATFTVGVDGTPPFTFQWRQNGSPIPSATNNPLRLATTTSSDNGAVISVSVSNSLGGVTSSNAILWIDPGIVSTQALSLLSISSISWKYDQSGSNWGTAWKETNFNDSAWSNGAAMFGYETTPQMYPEPFRTILRPPDMGGPITTYYRAHFNWPSNVSSATLISSNLLDDGAVFWINGQEAGRIRVIGSPVTYQTIAGSQTYEGVYEITNLLTSSLVPGDNLLAVELHQSSGLSSDVAFGMSLTAELTSRVPTNPPPVLVLQLPVAGATVQHLAQIEVAFSEPVQGVDASDLLINGAPATSLDIISPLQYVFEFTQPSAGLIQIDWDPQHGIADLAMAQFAGFSWSYFVSSNAPAPMLRINEFLSSNKTGLQDEDGAYSDWIEIYNAGSSAANLEGWALTDEVVNLNKWYFPTLTLLPNSYLIVFASGKDRTNASGQLHANFQLDRSGEFLGLVDPSNNVISAFAPSYPPQYSDMSYGCDRVSPDLLGFFSTPTPGGPNSAMGGGVAPDVTFSRNSGTFTDNFSLVLSTSLSNAVIRYTFGTNLPGTNSLLYTNPIAIANTVQVRARAFATGLLPGDVHSEAYIKLDTSTGVQNFSSELPIIVLHNYGGGVIPRVEDQFVLVQVFEPKGGRSFLTNAPDLGLKGIIHTRGSTTYGFIKASYFLEIQDEFRDDKNVSLAGLPEESDWVLYAPSFLEPILCHNPMAHEIFRQMGYYSSRTRFVEVYLKDDMGPPTPIVASDYYGIYVLEEKIKVDKNRVNIDKLQPQDSAAPNVTGGYLLSVDRPNVSTVPFNGAGTSVNFIEPDYFTINTPQRLPQKQYITGYFNAFGAVLASPGWADPVAGYPAYIDVANWIDYHMANFIVFNLDGLRLSCFLYKPRNGKLRMGPMWDYDRTQGSADGRDFDPATWRSTYWDQGTDMFNPSTSFSNPWFGKMFTDIDFWQKYIDRYQFWRKSVLSLSNVFTMIDGFVEQVRPAQGREVARWAGYGTSDTSPRTGGRSYGGLNWTFPGTYQGEIDFLKFWWSNRIAFVDGQFEGPPLMSRQEGPVEQGAVLFLDGPPNAIIFYTVDGTDPRAPGGSLSPTARMYTEPIILDANARVVARCRDLTHQNQTGPNAPPLSSPWSSAEAATFIVQTPPLVITEIMYHPAPPPAGDTNDAENFEYLEFKNLGTNDLNLRGFRLSGGVSFEFPDLILGAGQTILVVKDAAAFTSRYGGGIPIAGTYTGQLNNAGDRLVLTGPLLEPILDFSYSDEWHPITDGPGFSLVVADEWAPLQSWNAMSQWRRSSAVNGSPGQDDPALASLPPILVNEVLPNSTPPLVDMIELFNPTPDPVNLSGWFLSDSFSTPRKYRLTNGTVIPAYGFLVFYENSSFGLGPTRFALSSQGDEIYLFSGNAQTNLTGYFHGYDFGAQVEGVSLGRYTPSTGEDHFVAQTTRTFGQTNAAPKAGPIAISEIMYHPSDYVQDGQWVDNYRDEFIELCNSSTNRAPLYDPVYPFNTWRLREGIDFTFPRSVSLPAGGSLLVVGFNPTNTTMLDDFRARFSISTNVPIYGPWAGRLANDVQKVALARPDRPVAGTGFVPYILVERVKYTNDLPWDSDANGTGLSLQRLYPDAYGNDPTNWVPAFPAPGLPYLGDAPPTLLQEPADLVVTLCDAAVFSVQAEGWNCVYQWYFNETNPLAGASSSSLALSNLRPSDAGHFSVVVTNWLGAVTSRLAALTIVYGDCDSDGMPDIWELMNGLNPRYALDRNSDADGDGMSNYQECLAGTDPQNAADYLKVDEVRAGNPITIRFLALSNRTYTVQFINDLRSGTWEKLADVEAQPTNRVAIVTDPVPGANRCYRLVTPAQ